MEYDHPTVAMVVTMPASKIKVPGWWSTWNAEEATGLWKMEVPWIAWSRMEELPLRAIACHWRESAMFVVFFILNYLSVNFYWYIIIHIYIYQYIYIYTNKYIYIPASIVSFQKVQVETRESGPCLHGEQPPQGLAGTSSIYSSIYRSIHVCFHPCIYPSIIYI